MAILLSVLLKAILKVDWIRVKVKTLYSRLDLNTQSRKFKVLITFLTGVSRPIVVDQCSRIIYLIYLMLISLFSFVVFNVSVCVYFITYRLQFVIYM